MNETIEAIIKDLYALDPSLREHDAHIRALVAGLIAARPEVKIDNAFLRDVRARLLARAKAKDSRVEHTGRPAWEWWMFRAVPLGAVALLLIALVPQLSQLGLPINMPAPQAPELMQTTSEDASFTTTSQKRAGTTGQELMQKMSAVITTKGLVPIEGFEAEMYLNEFSNLLPKDFDGVQTFGGVMVFKNNFLSFVPNNVLPKTSAEKTISEEGYNTLLVNLHTRLGITLTVDEIVALISKK